MMPLLKESLPPNIKSFKLGKKRVYASQIFAFLNSHRQESDTQIIFVCSKPGKEKWKTGGGDVVVIPAGHCWVEGDNQEVSVDSRKYGPVSYGLIFGKANWVIYPFHRIRKLTSLSSPQDFSESTRVIGSEGVPTNYI